MKTWRVAGINFDHMHMGDNLRYVANHPNAEIVGIAHDLPERMAGVIEKLAIPADRVFTDYRACLEKTKPDIVILCPSTLGHGEWVEKVAPSGAHIILEKPFAASLAEADAIIRAVNAPGQRLCINWPLAWVPAYRTTKRLIDEGLIGDVIEVHSYGGNSGPLYHVEDKESTTEEYRRRERETSWFYKKSMGGGSLLDYLGYGTTIGSWFHDNRKPIEVIAAVDIPAGLEVDEQSVTIARYAHGLSTFQTRWGTFTNPWEHQPQPRCGFVVAGSAGTIAAYDYQQTIRIQTREKPEGYDLPVDPSAAPHQNPVQYLIHCLETDASITGPLSTEVSRIGQQIVDTALLSAQQKRTMPLVE